MIVADLVSATCMIVLILLFLLGAVALWHVCTMMAIRSAMQAFQAPAAAATTAMLVPAEFLPRSAGLHQTLYGVMSVGAAPLGAIAINVVPMGWALSVDVFTAVVGIVPLLVFAIPQARPEAQPGSTLWREFLEGVGTVWNDPALRRLYGLMTATSLVIMPTFTLIPLLVKVHFDGGPEQVALVESLGGFGIIAGGAVVVAMAPRRRVLWVLWGFAASNFALAATALPPGNQFWLSVVLWTMGAIAYSIGNAPFTVILQTTVPNHLQGRVLSLLSTLVGLSAPVGLVLATPLGEAIGVRWLFVLLGAVGGMVTLLGFLSPLIRGVDEAAYIGRSVRSPNTVPIAAHLHLAEGVQKINHDPGHSGKSEFCRPLRGPGPRSASRR